jgi:glycosyltransferase involved in cell wall biosynthesis
MTLLFITQKLHGQDAFGALWIRAFERMGYTVEVICLEDRTKEISQILGASGSVIKARIHSLGKERGATKLTQIMTFMRYVRVLSYDRVFIHMTPVWGIFGMPTWLFRRTPVYLWYTHYQMQLGLWLLGLYAKRMFCATVQSLPQYAQSPKKIVTGHGIDLEVWPRRPNSALEPHRLLVVHRLSRSKRLERSIRALTFLPHEFTIDVYGIEAEPEYVAELRHLVQRLGLESRVTFHGTVPSKELPALYGSHRLLLNMASETIDKTMLEAMTCGCYPVTTPGNAQAIGIKQAPVSDTPEAIAEFVLRYAHEAPLSPDAMYKIVEEQHSLQSLIVKMDAFIREGI